MATVIPVEGELIERPSPDTMAEVEDLILSSDNLTPSEFKSYVWVSPTKRDAFVGQVGFGFSFQKNQRATNFARARGYPGEPFVGTAVFLSEAEFVRLVQIIEDPGPVNWVPASTTPAISPGSFLGVLAPTPAGGSLPTPTPSPVKVVANPPPADSLWVALTGNTYPVRQELRDLGGKWDKEKKAWTVPAPLEFKARGIIARGPVSKDSYARSNPSPTNPKPAFTTPPSSDIDPTSFGSVRRNRHPGPCRKCGKKLLPNDGILLRDEKNRWVVECPDSCRPSPNELESVDFGVKKPEDPPF